MTPKGMFDPERQRLPNGLPFYYDEIGPVAAMPKLYVAPLEKEELKGFPQVRISVMLLDSPNCGRWYETIILDKALESFFSYWRRSPESVLRNNFKWPGMLRPRASVPAKAVDLSPWADLLGDLP